MGLTAAPQDITPMNIQQHLPTAGPSSITLDSDDIWSSINLSEGFNVTLPGTQDLTPEAMIVANRIFNLAECTGGPDTPSPFRRLLTPHPESPGRLTQEQIAGVSSRITSDLMVTPSSSPPHPEFIPMSESEPLQEQMENFETDLTQRFGATTIAPQPTTPSHPPNPDTTPPAVMGAPQNHENARLATPMSDLTSEDSSEDSSDDDSDSHPPTHNQVALPASNQVQDMAVDNQVQDMDVDNDEVVADHQEDILQPDRQPDNRHQDQPDAEMSSGEEEVDPPSPPRRRKITRAAVARAAANLSDRRLRSGGKQATVTSSQVLPSTHTQSEPSIDAPASTPLQSGSDQGRSRPETRIDAPASTPRQPASNQDRSRPVRKGVKGSFEGKLHGQVWHFPGYI